MCSIPANSEWLNSPVILLSPGTISISLLDPLLLYYYRRILQATIWYRATIQWIKEGCVHWKFEWLVLFGTRNRTSCSLDEAIPFIPVFNPSVILSLILCKLIELIIKLSEPPGINATWRKMLSSVKHFFIEISSFVICSKNLRKLHLMLQSVHLTSIRCSDETALLRILALSSFYRSNTSYFHPLSFCPSCTICRRLSL